MKHPRGIRGLAPRPPLSWRARRRGNVYCAPACGFGCKRDDYDRAVKRAAALALACGSGWRAKVWENLGWHFKAVSPCGHVHVHQNGPRDYMAFLAAEPNGCGGGRWAERGNTPRLAVEAAMRKAREDMNEIARNLAAVRV